MLYPPIGRPRHGTLPFGSRGGVCITIRAAVSTGTHDTLLQGACAAPFCKKRKSCASLKGVLRSVKLMRVIFPTRGGINRLSRLARLPARQHRQRILSIKPTPIREPSLVFAALIPRLARALTDRRHGVPQRRKEKARRFLYVLSRLYCTASFVLLSSLTKSHYVPLCPNSQKCFTPSSCKRYIVIFPTLIFP